MYTDTSIFENLTLGKYYRVVTQVGFDHKGRGVPKASSTFQTSLKVEGKTLHTDQIYIFAPAPGSIHTISEKIYQATSSQVTVDTDIDYKGFINKNSDNVIKNIIEEMPDPNMTDKWI